MKNEIIHGKIILDEDILEHVEEYRLKHNWIGFDMRQKVFTNCIFKNIDGFISTMIGCIFRGCVFKDVRFYSAWFADECQNVFEDCMFFNCVIEDTGFNDKINLPESTNMRCPRYDKIIGYKIIFRWNFESCTPVYLLATLEIPTGVKRSSSLGNKCRCEYAKVLSIVDQDGVTYNYGLSAHCQPGKSILYKVGEYVYPVSFDENRFNECASGIHFFMTPEEAWDYAK